MSIQFIEDHEYYYLVNGIKSAFGNDEQRLYSGRFGAYNLIICFTLNLAIWIFNLKRNVCFKVLSFFLNLLMLYLFIWVCAQAIDFAFTRDPRADATLETLKFVFTMFCPEEFCPAINFSSYESPF